MFCSKSFVVLRLVWFLLLDTTASGAPSGTIHAVYTNSSSILASSDAPSTSTPVLGDHIASGLGLSSQDAHTTSSSPSAGFMTPTSSALHDNVTTPADQCWAKWSSYWDLSSKAKTMYTTFTTERTYNSVTGWSIQPWYSTSEVTSTVTEGNGNFPTKTYVTTFVTSEKVTQTFSTTEANTTDVVTDTVSATITKPPCSLPSYVPQCQDSWISWGSNGAVSYGQPQCTQASISGAMCSSVLSQWLNYQRAEMGEISGKIGMQWLPETNNGTTVWPSSTTNYYWPTSSAVAPGCTVGCQSCRVSGSRVKLLYWPPETSRSANGTYFAATGRSKHTSTVVTDGTTLTSPTVYISFDKLHASNSCSVIGKTLSNIIVAVTNSATLSSLYGWDRYWGLQQTASFNFTDLYATPIPHSIYMSQPRCASSSVSLVYSCLPFGNKGPEECNTSNTPLLCATTLPYEPVIAIPKEVQQLQPDWGSCIGGIIGVYDPPSALHEVASEAGVTLPSDPKTTQQEDSSPDATTPATPAHTASQAPAPTQVVATSETAQPASSPTSQDEDSGPTDSSSTDVEAEPTNIVPQTTSGSSPSNQASELPSGQEPKDPPASNALDVFSEAAAQFSQSLTAGGTASESTTQASEAGPNDPGPSAHGPGSGSGITSTEGNAPIFSFDPSTTPDQNTATGPVGQSHNSIPPAASRQGEDPSYTTNDQPLYTFDPPSAASNQPNEPLATITANSHVFTAVQSGTNMILVDPSTTRLLSPGQETTLDTSRTLAFQPSQGLVVGDTTIYLNSASPATATPAAVWTASNGNTFTAIAHSSAIVVAGPETTINLPADHTAATVIDGKTIAPLPNQSGLVVDGSTIPLPTPSAASDEAAIYTAPNGDSISAIPNSNSAIILAGPSSSIALNPGSATTLHDHTFSAASTGGAVVVDGSSTMDVKPHAEEETSLPAIVTSSDRTTSSTETTAVTSSEQVESSALATAAPTSAPSSAGLNSGQAHAWLALLPLLYAAVSMVL